MSYIKKNKGKFFPVLFGIVWGIIFAVTVWLIASIFTFDENIYGSPEQFTNDILSENYGSFYCNICYNTDDGLSIETHPEYGELIGIADYFEAAGQYYLYLDNNEEKAGYYKDKMQKALNEMNRLSSLSEGIEEYLTD